MAETKHELKLDVYDDVQLSFGQSVYCIRVAEDKFFSDKCPICDDTKKVTIRGKEFSCPNCCGTGYSHSSNSATHIYLKDYQMDEYIINSITLCGPDTKCSYSKGALKKGGRIKASYKGFVRYNNSYMSVYSRDFRSGLFGHTDPTKVLDPKDCAFVNKADCKSFIRRLHEIQKEKLEQFNAEHGTSYEYPFSF